MLFLYRWDNIHDFGQPSAVIKFLYFFCRKFHSAGDGSVESIVSAAAYILPGNEFCASLADDNTAGLGFLTVVQFYA